MKTIFFLFIQFSLCYAAPQDSLEEKEIKLMDFDNIRKVIKNDGLESSQKNKIQEAQQIKEEKVELIKDRYKYPVKGDFYSFISKLWLVKNAPTLQWDFTKPDYGIESAIAGILTKFGYINEEVNVLICNSPLITHLALPMGERKMLFIISLPFMRTLDLTKLDISLLFLENFFRIKDQALISLIKVDKEIIGSSFYGVSMELKAINKYLSEISRIAFTDGFTFKQQYQVTMKMDSTLKVDLPMWSRYLLLLKKVDQLIKVNKLYNNYSKIYPSPEIQQKWLAPKKKI